MTLRELARLQVKGCQTHSSGRVQLLKVARWSAVQWPSMLSYIFCLKCFWRRPSHKTVVQVSAVVRASRIEFAKK